MKSVVELLKENRKEMFIPVKDNSSGLTADIEESFVEELLEDELSEKKNKD